MDMTIHLIRTPLGKKRAREDEDPAEAKPPKRVRIAKTPAETAKKVTIKKAKATSAGKAGKVICSFKIVLQSQEPQENVRQLSSL
jgi:hypothetical protein